MALEMVQRGYKFENINLEKSDATNFVVDKENKVFEFDDDGVPEGRFQPGAEVLEAQVRVDGDPLRQGGIHQRDAVEGRFQRGPTRSISSLSLRTSSRKKTRRNLRSEFRK